MQVIALVSALFAATALAGPQWGRFPPNGGYPGFPGNGGYPGGFPGFPDGNQEGPYQGGCSCSRNGVPDQWLGQQACQDLNSQYPNLQWIGNGCVDFNGRGVEANGFRRACQRQAGGYEVVDSNCGF